MQLVWPDGGEGVHALVCMQTGKKTAAELTCPAPAPVVCPVLHTCCCCCCLLQAVVGQIVDGLFSVLVTLGVVPIIRCPKGGAAEHVAAALEGKLRDHLKARR
jgi:hypothetical protein